MDKLVRLSYIGKSAAEAVASTGAQAAGAVAEKWEGFGDYFDRQCNKLNAWAAGNRIGRGFMFKERNAKLTVEIRAGIITFFVVAYILAVNPSVLATTGGTCDPEVDCTNYATEGRQCLLDPEDPKAVQCMDRLKLNLVTATAASSLISTFLVGYFANLPLALAPGLGINAYIAYQVVGPAGSGELSYQQAMAAIFIEGWIFLVLSVTGVRGGIVKHMPKCIAIASTVGIGLLLAFTGLRNLGVVVFDPSTMVSLGGCSEASRTYIYSFPGPLNGTLPDDTFASLASVYGCADKQMRSATMWLGIAGGFLMAFLLFMGVKGAVISGMAFVTIVSWIPGHAASYLGSGSAIPGGQARLNVFKQVVAAPTLDMTGLAWDWSAFGTGHLWIALFTFLYIDLLDCTGTLLSMAQVLDNMMPGFIDARLEFPGQMWAYLSDGIGIVTGSMMGTTPLTVYLESAAGIEEGGRTGVTAIVVAFFFFVSLFFSPILASIPPYATGPALVLVGCLLLGHVGHIKWDDVGEAIPAFLTIVMMPFTYSVAYGVIAGLVAFIAIHTPSWLYHGLFLLRAKLNPRDDAASRDGQSSHRSRQRQIHRKVFGGNGSMQPSRGGSDNGSMIGDESLRGGRAFEGGSFAGYDNSFHGGSQYSNSFHNAMRIPPPMIDPKAASTELVGRSPPYGRSPNVSAHGGLPILHNLRRGSAGPQADGMQNTTLAEYRRGLSSPARPPAAGAYRAISTPVEAPGRAGGGLRRPPGLSRSRTFTSGVDTLGPQANLYMEQQPGPSSSQGGRGGGFLLFPGVPSDGPPQREFKLFGNVDLPAPSGGAAPQQEFKLFGDVDLPAPSGGAAPQQEFKLFGDVDLPSSIVDAAPKQEFKLFGDVELPAPSGEEEAGGRQLASSAGKRRAFVEGRGPGLKPSSLDAVRRAEEGQRSSLGSKAEALRQPDGPVAPLTDTVVSRVEEESPQVSVQHWLANASLGTTLGRQATATQELASVSSSALTAALAEAETGSSSKVPPPEQQFKRKPASD